MKPVLVADWLTENESLPARGAWVETMQDASCCSTCSVAPRKGSVG